jgi:hypothetical protein
MQEDTVNNFMLKNGKPYKNEQKYFIAYVAYSNTGDKLDKDIFNNIIYIDSEIISELINDIEKSLVDKINSNCKSHPLYYATQIININKI